MAKLLITGGAGFIGSQFVGLWLAKHPGDGVVVLDALTYAGKLQNLAACRKQIHFIKGDICDQAAVAALLHEHAIDHIVHFAAESHVDRSIARPDAFIKTNIEGTHSLLKAARQVWLGEPTKPMAHRFHHISTDEVYGSLSAQQPAFTEDSPYAPNSPYAASKAAADHLVRAYHQTYGLQTIISSCSNNYGPRQHPEKLLPLTISHCVHGLPIPIYGDGQQIRDWIYVDDHCRAIELVIEKGSIGETYNIGGDCQITNLSLVQRVCELIDARFSTDQALRERFANSPAARGQPCSSLIEHVTDRLGHDRRYAINSAKLVAATGFTPRHRLDDGLALCIDWYLANPDWLLAEPSRDND